jgi:hypothetical protein
MFWLDKGQRHPELRAAPALFLGMLLLSGAAAAAGLESVPLRGLNTTHYIEVPEDLGPATIDVSDYPQEYQDTYRAIFLRVYAILRGGPARAINSPRLELDPQGEQALRRQSPELFASEDIVDVGEHSWRDEVMRVKSRPPCCGACPQLTMDQARRLWRFLVYDSLRRKTGDQAQAWAAHRRKLLEQFAARRPNT